MFLIFEFVHFTRLRNLTMLPAYVTYFGRFVLILVQSVSDSFSSK